MDALTFGSKILIRNLTESETKTKDGRKIALKIREYILERILKNLDMSFEQFVDLCILLGCDYCPSIRGIGRVKAFELISQYKTIENVLENIDHNKFPPPENWKYAQARKLFLQPETTPGEEFDQFEWIEPKSDEIIKFLCEEKGFNVERIKSALDRLHKSRGIAKQGRIDMFFKPICSQSTTEQSSTKRKAEEDKKKNVAKASAKKPKGK